MYDILDYDIRKGPLFSCGGARGQSQNYFYLSTIFIKFVVWFLTVIMRWFYSSSSYNYLTNPFNNNISGKGCFIFLLPPQVECILLLYTCHKLSVFIYCISSSVATFYEYFTNHTDDFNKCLQVDFIEDENGYS